MKKIFVAGAGRSSVSLIDYLLKNAAENSWHITVADASLALAEEKVNNHPNGTAIAFDATNGSQREQEISTSDIVVSLLPPSLHYLLAKDCVKFKKNMTTASYVSKEMAALDEEVKKAEIIFLNECGLDPGIDHMSAMKIIDIIHEEGGNFSSFKSFCGGLIAPESNDNPWGYKFTWNPRNVVLAGQGGDAQFLENGKVSHISYNQLFQKIEKINVEGYGDFDGYANRDSLSYIPHYHLEGISALMRGTLRNSGFCEAWDCLIQLDLTNDEKKYSALENKTWKEFISVLHPDIKSKESLADYLKLEKNSPVLEKLNWLGILSDEKLEIKEGTAANFLQLLLEKKWNLKKNDRDMVVLHHHFEYSEKNNSKKKKITSSLVVKGKDSVHTAMAMTVGLPLAIATKLILQEKIKSKGVVIPVMKEFYEPVLKELETLGIKFSERQF